MTEKKQSKEGSSSKKQKVFDTPTPSPIEGSEGPLSLLTHLALALSVCVAVLVGSYYGLVPGNGKVSFD
jgi:hypothetical protein